ncbi:MAG: hypothetical protein IPK82_28785 [Polyangiaceae bacterium]|nr:hypothetical protein [Polyangiaceae bacterium]
MKWLGLGCLAICLAACDGSVTTGPGGTGGTGASVQTTGTGAGGGTGGVSTGGGTTGSTSSSTGTTGTGGFSPGECSTNADCPGGECVPLEAGGFLVCKFPVEEATMCGDSGLDQCCTTADCKEPGTKCLKTPITPFCGGAQMLDHNQCAKDACDDASGCQADEICAPAGALGNKVRVCIKAGCHGTVCGQESLSQCGVYKESCCGVAVGLYCLSGCKTDADCPGGYCTLDGSSNHTKCEPGAPPCPL